jgi:hypothetical protein
MKKSKIRYVMVSDGYEAEDLGGADAAAEAGADTETETEDGSDVRLECLKLAVNFCKTKGQPIAVATDFLAFVLAQEPAAPTSDAPPPDSGTRP